MKKPSSIRIGGASGFWGDSSVGAAQLVRQGQVDFLVFDYLAELTLSVLAAARLRHPEAGYATDFVTVTLKALLPEILCQGIRVISNAGGIHPQACAKAIRELADSMGLEVRIAVVEGDDVMPLLPRFLASGTLDLQTGRPIPERLLSANAYLGALPIRQALDQGAQIVVTGRCVDSAVTLGALMHAFDWSASDHDLLAMGSLAGHLIECGCQATGGLHTDWSNVPDWPHIGYPIIECQDSGDFVVTKPPGTGGLVNRATVGEQILYEIGDPSAYLLPDVICDFTQVKLEAVADDRVRVSGAKGRAPSDRYKVSATYLDGYRCNADLIIIGEDAVAKAKRTAHAILTRMRELFAQQGWSDFSRSHVEVIGSESVYGPHAQAHSAREVVMRLAVTHPRQEALEWFAREIAPAGTSWSAGTAGSITSGRPKPSPAIHQSAFLVDKQWLSVRLTLAGEEQIVTIPPGDPYVPESHCPGQVSTAKSGSLAPFFLPPGSRCVSLIELAYARSGDKGDVSNIGVMARRPEWVPLLRDQVTAERVAQWLAHLVKGRVTRYELPGFHAFNFVCEAALDGGGMTSLRSDPLGKSMAQILLALPLAVPDGPL